MLASDNRVEHVHARKNKKMTQKASRFPSCPAALSHPQLDVLHLLLVDSHVGLHHVQALGHAELFHEKIRRVDGGREGGKHATGRNEIGKEQDSADNLAPTQRRVGEIVGIYKITFEKRDETLYCRDGCRITRKACSKHWKNWRFFRRSKTGKVGAWACISTCARGQERHPSLCSTKTS